MKYLVLIYFCMIANLSFSNVFITSYQTITSFPNLMKDGSYIVDSGRQKIQFSFPVFLTPFTKVKISGKKYGNKIIVSSSNNLEIISHQLSFLIKFSEMRIQITKILLKNSSNPGLILALLFGNKDFLHHQFKYLIQNSGLSHIFALSGMHLAIVLGLFVWLSKIMDIPLRFQIFLLLFPALAYLMLGGMSISLLRAFLFYFIWAVFKFFRVPIPLYKIWFISLIINLLLVPSYIYSLSFILSYVAILGIIVSLRHSFFIEKLGNYFGGLISTSLGAFTFVFPIVVYVFGYINLGSIFVSIIILPFMPFVIVILFISLFCCMLGFNILIIDNILNICYKLIHNVSYFVSTYFPTIFLSESLKSIVSICLILTLVWLEINYQKRNKNVVR